MPPKVNKSKKIVTNRIIDLVIINEIKEKIYGVNETNEKIK